MPADKAGWLAAGVAPATILVNFDWWAVSDPHLWAVAVLGLALGLVGAYVQPERRSLPRWALAWLAFYGTPRRAT